MIPAGLKRNKTESAEIIDDFEKNGYYLCALCFSASEYVVHNFKISQLMTSVLRRQRTVPCHSGDREPSPVFFWPEMTDFDKKMAENEKSRLTLAESRI